MVFYKELKQEHHGRSNRSFQITLHSHSFLCPWFFVHLPWSHVLQQRFALGLFNKYGRIISGNGLYAVVEKRAGISIVSVAIYPLKLTHSCHFRSSNWREEIFAFFAFLSEIRESLLREISQDIESYNLMQ